MSTLQKWLAGLTGLGALYLVVTNPAGFYTASSALKQATGGTIATITTGGKA